MDLLISDSPVGQIHYTSFVQAQKFINALEVGDEFSVGRRRS